MGRPAAALCFNKREKMISVYGATGFIGNEFCDLYSEQIVKIPKKQLKPETSEILYMISTIDNYNVFSNPHLDIDTNLKLLINVLEECKDRKDIVFNFVSSWFVYGKTDKLPAHEDSACNPKGFYSITKRTAEQLLISYCETFKIKYRIFRLCNVYGKTDSKVSKKRNALQHLIGEIVNDRDINLYNGGSDIRDFMHVKDVCRAINLCMEKSPLNEIINIGSGIPYKFIDLMSYVKEVLNSKSKLLSMDPPEFHKTVQIKDIYLDVSKLKKIQFIEEYNIWLGLNEIIQNYKENN